MSWVGVLADMLWEPWLLGLFLFTGLVYSLGSGFFQLFGLPFGCGPPWADCSADSEGKKAGCPRSRPWPPHWPPPWARAPSPGWPPL